MEDIDIGIARAIIAKTMRPGMAYLLMVTKIGYSCAREHKQKINLSTLKVRYCNEQKARVVSPSSRCQTCGEQPTRRKPRGS